MRYVAIEDADGKGRSGAVVGHVTDSCDDDDDDVKPIKSLRNNPGKQRKNMAQHSREL